jgi:4-aminobutyrate aminotransferase-like enzyme
MVTYSGPRGNVFRIQPVLSISEAQIDSVISAFDEAIGQVVEG